ncbi:MAG: methyltransferase domain-containing protein [Vicinamibacterales bacterium]
MPFVVNPRERFLPKTSGPNLLVGGAGRPPRSEFITLDIVRFPGVAVQGDVECLPIRTGSVASIECDAVLEHVRRPEQAVKELHRVLAPGGYLHVVVPFCHPFHAYPDDFHRWTLAGLEYLLSDFVLLESGVRTGPTAALLTHVLDYVKLLSPSRLKRPVYFVVGWLLWPLRYADGPLMRRADAHSLGNTLYALAQKRQTTESPPGR